MPTVLEALNQALSRALRDDPQVLLLGEDILDPYGGAFKVTRGLSSQFPERVLASPISETSLVGLATGMALRGLRPVVEIMFGDFITLAVDPLVNSAAKFRWMYNEQVRVPLVVRTPMGGRRGYGPTHSQSLEKLFLGVPGLQVLAPTSLSDPGELLYQAICSGQDPTLFIENKLLYLQPVAGPRELGDFEVVRSGPHDAPTLRLRIAGAPQAHLTLAAYGYMAELARQAVQRLAFEAEIFAELIIPTRLSPMDWAPLLASAGQTGRLLAIEEGSLTLGWGAEVLARAIEGLGGRLRSAARVAARDLPVPASGPLEAAVLPGIEEILAAAKKMV